MAVQIGAHFPDKQEGGSGVLLGEVPGVPKEKLHHHQAGSLEPTQLVSYSVPSDHLRYPGTATFGCSGRYTITNHYILIHLTH